MKTILTVLHIDDDPDTRFLLRELLSQPESEAGRSSRPAAAAEGPDRVHLEECMGQRGGENLTEQGEGGEGRQNRSGRGGQCGEGRQKLEEAELAAICWLEAGGVEEALARHQKSQPDLILLDHRLGGQSGLDLLPAVRGAWACPVWILTGFSPEAIRERAAESGAAGVIPKDELLANAAGLRTLLLACYRNGQNRPINR